MRGLHLDLKEHLKEWMLAAPHTRVIARHSAFEGMAVVRVRDTKGSFWLVLGFGYVRSSKQQLHRPERVPFNIGASLRALQSLSLTRTQGRK